eukprot:m51a1_g10028 hypothetical protein (1013) ;mRNA; r:106735-110223
MPAARSQLQWTFVVLWLFVVQFVLPAPPAALSAAAAAPFPRLDLLALSQPPSGFRLAGLPADGAFCTDVAPAGDVDGDNVGDLVVGAPHANATGPGRAVLVLGAGLRAHAGPLSVAGLLAAGAAVELLGSSAGDFSVGSAVGTAGDLNGDGVDDVAVGAPGEGPNASGALYVVWGHTGAWPRSLRLSAVGTAELPGVVLRGDTSDGLGSAVRAAGDIDGDGVGDLVVGAEKWPWHGDPHGMGTDGKAYVVFGRKNWTSPGVAVKGLGLTIESRMFQEKLGHYVSSGDFNGDNITDVVVGSDNLIANWLRTYVAYGRRGRSMLGDVLGAKDIGNETTPGFVVKYNSQEHYLDHLGISSVGDIDGDGIDDLGIGVNVVFGSRDHPKQELPMDDPDSAFRGTKLSGRGVECGYSSPTRAGDLDGDSLDDLAVVARPEVTETPKVVVVFGRAVWPSVFQVSGDPGCAAGFELAFSNPAGYLLPLLRAGDINGDRVVDYIVGISDRNRTDAREVHVVYGVATPAPRVAKLVLTRGRLTPITAELLGANTTAQRFEVSVHVMENTSHGHFALASSPNASVELFTLADVDEGRVVFAHDGSASVPGVTLAMSTLRNGCRLSAPVSAAVELVEPPAPPQPESSERSSSFDESSNASSSSSWSPPPPPHHLPSSSSSSSKPSPLSPSSGDRESRAQSSAGGGAETARAPGGRPEVAAIAAPVSVVGFLLLAAAAAAAFFLWRRRRTSSPSPSPSQSQSPSPRDSVLLTVISPAPEEETAGADSEPRQLLLLASLPDGELPVSERRALAGKELAGFERSFRQYYQMHHEDYTASRIRQNMAPLIFVVTAAWEVRNPVLEAWYEARRRYMEDTLRRTGEELEERVAFHGTMERNVGPICDLGLLRVGHPLNPSHSTDTGFFGDPHRGVYASRFVEYTLQYSNVKSASDGTECPVQIVMFKALPGKTLHMKAVAVAVQPTAGYDSHSSPQWSEWFFFDETQLCPTHVVQVLAITNKRTEANEGM